MICVLFYCAMVLPVESVYQAPPKIERQCEAWELERCEPEYVASSGLAKRSVTIFNHKTGEIDPRIKLYHQACIDEDTWSENDCESFVGEYYLADEASK